MCINNDTPSVFLYLVAPLPMSLIAVLGFLDILGMALTMSSKAVTISSSDHGNTTVTLSIISCNE